MNRRGFSASKRNFFLSFAYKLSLKIWFLNNKFLKLHRMSVLGDSLIVY